MDTVWSYVFIILSKDLISDHLFWLLVYNEYFSTWHKMHLESLKLLLYLEKILYLLLKNLDTLQSWVDEWSWDDAKSFWKEFAFQMQISVALSSTRYFERCGKLSNPKTFIVKSLELLLWLTQYLSFHPLGDFSIADKFHT